MRRTTRHARGSGGRAGFGRAAGIAALLLSAGPLLHAGVCDGISQVPAGPLTTVRVASGLVRPVHLTAPPEDTARLFVVEQGGAVRIVRDGAVLPAPFLSIAALTRSPGNNGGGREEGLLGMAFHPDYATNGWFFVYHTSTDGQANVVARYTVSTNPDVADPNTRQVVISVPHPSNRNHNGGMIAFGPTDGLLYIGTGDGGGSCDTSNNAQDLTDNLGKMLRLDVDALPYAIPAGNPFAGAADPNGTANDEIWSYGLRNPWRWSFAGPMAPDPQAVFIGDVGQGEWEEIDYSPGGPGGENYGWRPYEGPDCPNPSCAGAGSCLIPDHVPPIHFYRAAGDCAVTGGYVYHGCRMPALHGRYFYSDYCSAFIRSFRVVGGAAVDPIDHTTELDPGVGLNIRTISSYGVDARGEIYLLDYDEFGLLVGEVFKIVPVLSNMEVSGAGAVPFTLGPTWQWEDLRATSMHPIAAYRVYRGDPGAGPFTCVHQTPSTSWTGDANPPLGEIRAYLVTAVNTAGLASSPGTGTGGTARVLSPAACP